jgi:peptidoglycan/xylan/chitin deacetylase (PgdA/CDA1 family)
MGEFNKVAIIMYHFVRDLHNSRYPKIKGLNLSSFVEQLDYLQEKYNLITMELLINSLDTKESLPPNAAILTFDDAYMDHFTNVFPILVDRKIQGAFYAPAKAVYENTILNVNKIHFILASTDDIKKIINRTFLELDKYRAEYKLQSNDFYFKNLAIANHLDIKEVIFIKRLLQKELPEELRNNIIDILFEEFVGMSESVFSKELYMSKTQMKCMLQNGMHIGNHGYNHYWLNTISEDKQRIEIKKGCEFLMDIGVNMNNWTMSYPYGAYNESLIKILKENNCKLGLTTIVDVADLSTHNRYELPRLDTNDISKEMSNRNIK